MSLNEKIEKYSAPGNSQNDFSTIGKEIITEMRNLINDIKDDNALPEKTQENTKKLHEAYLKLPHIFFYNHSQGLLEAILDLSTENIYKAFFDVSFDFSKPVISDSQPKSSDELVLFMLVNYLEKVPIKELLGYLKTYNEKKQKNPALKLLIVELYHFVMVRIDKKEVYLGEILPALLKTLNPSLARYIKYKTKVDNNQYTETPKHIVQYLLNYENWIKSVLQKVMKSLVEIIHPQKGERRLLFINDVYDTYVKQGDLKRKTPSNDRLITHYCVLFILDIFEGLIDCRGNAYFLKENIDSFIENVIQTLLEIHHNLHDYIWNFLLQLKIKKIDESISMFNQKDNYNLPVGNYDKLTLYNSASIAYLSVRLTQRPKEAVLLTADYKLQLLLPCTYQVFLISTEKHELKTELLTTASNLFQSLATHNIAPIDNLNKFGVPLDIIIERVLDHTSGTTDEKERSVGVDILITVKKLLTERSLAKLLISGIIASRNHSLYGYLVTEYKTGITNVLKNCGNVNDIKEISSPFLNAGYFRKLFEVGIDSTSPKFKDNSELISSCANILMLIYMRLANLAKGAEDYKSIKFKDPNNLFNPSNFKALLNFGEKAKGLEVKVKEDIQMFRNQVDKMSAENPENQAIQTYNVKMNEFMLILDSIDRIGELHGELKETLNLHK